jgi:DNA-binding beta-propeller fold protein YncE
VTNGADNTVSVIDTATCNTDHPGGCAVAAPVVRLAGSPVGGALDPISGSVLVPTMDPVKGVDGPGWLSIIDTAACHAGALAGCAHPPVRTGLGFGPIDVAVNPTTRRAYVVNLESRDVSVVDLDRCNAHDTDACQQAWPTLGIGRDGGGVAVAPATDTVYASAQADANVTVLDAGTRRSLS